MTLAIANHELAKEHFPGVMPDPEEWEEPVTCGAVADDGRICIGEQGHRGRHRFRPIPFAGGIN